ncbi:hypothetical protein ACLOJK_020523 [Asimina triloba]
MGLLHAFCVSSHDSHESFLIPHELRRPCPPHCLLQHPIRWHEVVVAVLAIAALLSTHSTQLACDSADQGAVRAALTKMEVLGGDEEGRGGMLSVMESSSSSSSSK